MNPRISDLMRWLIKKEPTPRGAVAAAQHAAESLGPWSSILASGYIPRQVNPWLYEALRESIGLLDGSLDALVTLDGIVSVQGDNDKLVAEIEDWIDSVPVNDLETGLQAFYESQGNEVYEQGFNVGEWVLAPNGRDIERLRVADSKGIVFARTEAGLDAYYRAPPRHPSSSSGLDAVESVLRRTPGLCHNVLLGQGFQRIDPARMLYIVNSPEADNPYGTSKLRSLEFVSQILLKIENAVGRSWERYGDPPLHLQYKTKNAKINEIDLDRRKAALQAALAEALKSKSGGNSVDLVTAVGAMDEVLISVIGAQGIALDSEGPVRTMKDEIHAKIGVPAWLIGLDSSGGPVEQQSEMVLQQSRTRWARRKAGMTQLVATMLRLRGRTWKRGDWKLVQELPSLQNIMKIAQAKFLEAQAEMVMGRSTGQDRKPQGIDNNLRSPRQRGTRKVNGCKTADDEGPGEPWAEPDSQLPRIERQRANEQIAQWWVLAADVGDALGFDVDGRSFKGAKVGETFAMTPAQLVRIIALGDKFKRETSTLEGPIVRAAWEAWARGWANASSELSVDTAIDSVRERVREELRERGGEQIATTTGRAYRERVVSELASGAYDGMNHAAVAADLERKFGLGEYDWERVVASEMASAQSRGKRELYRQNGYELYDFTTADDGDVCPICDGLAADGPYAVDDAASPIPVDDSHPLCRCSISPHVPE